VFYSILPAPTQITLEEANAQRSYVQVGYNGVVKVVNIPCQAPQPLQVRNRAPPYGQRHGWVPRSLEVR